jgi:hypothetical protein
MLGEMLDGDEFCRLITKRAIFRSGTRQKTAREKLKFGVIFRKGRRTRSRIRQKESCGRLIAD